MAGPDPDLPLSMRTMLEQDENFKDRQAPVADLSDLDLSALETPEEAPKKPAKSRGESGKKPPRKPATARESSTPKPDNKYLVKMIPAEKITPWKFANRPDSEFGDDWDGFVRSIAGGVDMPITVRPDPNKKGHYEQIVGRKRHRACLEIGQDVPCFVQQLNDQDAAALQQRENDKRGDLSAWANARSWHQLLEEGVFKSQSALAVSLEVDRRKVNELMAYMRIDQRLYDEIADLGRVPLRVAKELSALTKDGNHVDTLLPIADQIRDGKISQKQLQELCRTRPTPAKPKTIRVNGVDSHTLRRDSNGTAVISLRKELLEHVTPEEISKLISKLHLEKLSDVSDKIKREDDDN